MIGAIDDQKTTILVTLDISAAFDTIDWNTLIQRLTNYFGVDGMALKWIQSYVMDRKQYVKIGHSESPITSVQAGVPQGSVLGPILFSSFLAPLASVISSFDIRHHQYADDAQIYHCFKPSSNVGLCNGLNECLDAVSAWFLSNGLLVNPDKSDAILVGTDAQRKKIHFDGVMMSGTHIGFSDHVKSLGVTLDTQLNLEMHVINVCKSCNYHIKALRAIRLSLDDFTAEAIGRSIVMARLDYCNGLLIGIAKQNLDHLQRIQNSLARVVTRSDYRQHIKPMLQSLHWLPVKERIEFKLATLTFKSRCGLAPGYLSELITDYHPTRELRSCSLNLLNTPRVKTVLGARAFSYAAPAIWNKLPADIKAAKTLNNFKTKLKTYYFRNALTV
jgi:hypothetical protein